MKSMIALALLACASAQVPYPGFPNGPYATAYTTAYAPTFGYAAYGAPLATAAVPELATPASTVAAVAAPRTALDVFNQAYPYYYNAGFAAPYYHAAFAAAPWAAAPVVAAAAAPAAVAAEPLVKSVGEVSVVEAAADDDVDVVEADASPIVPVGPVQLRPIFPIFSTDLRSGQEELVFARPDEIVPVKPAVIKEESDELPAVVLTPDFVGRSLLAPAVPAGIAQATQPRYYYI